MFHCQFAHTVDWNVRIALTKVRHDRALGLFA